MTENQKAHAKLIADLVKARDESMGESRALFRRAVTRLETLNDLVNRMLDEKKSSPSAVDQRPKSFSECCHICGCKVPPGNDICASCEADSDVQDLMDRDRG